VLRVLLVTRHLEHHDLERWFVKSIAQRELRRFVDAFWDANGGRWWVADGDGRAWNITIKPGSRFAMNRYTASYSFEEVTL
jgi:hypothetical protein